MQLVREADKRIVKGQKAHLPFQLRKWMDDFEDDADVVAVYYQAPASVIRDRLELKGYTLQVAEAALTVGLRSEAALYKKWSNEPSTGEFFEATAKALEGADADSWMAGIREIRERGLARRPHGGLEEEFEGTLIGYMLTHDWYGCPNPDTNIGLRLALEVCQEGDDFIYDVTDLVLSDQFSPDEDLVAYTIGVSSSEYAANGKTIVLTEGKSDTWMISESLKLLFPHLADYFSFMDFDGVRVGGGAGNLANTLRAFAGAGVVNRVIALFDDDTAAEAAIRNFPTSSLPPNMCIRKLPPLKMLESYPTIGPSGPALMDVNGVAAGIELYLGVDVLTDADGNFPPVQWTGYDAGVRKYQGEVLDKAGIQRRFKTLLTQCRNDGGRLQETDWSGMRSVLRTIFVAFHEEDGLEILHHTTEYFSDAA